MFNYLNEQAAKFHEANAHWWRDPATGNRITREKGVTLFLIISELIEAGEGERKSLMDDHLPNRPMAEVELADAMIRLMDYVGAHKYDIDFAMSRAYPTLRGKHWAEMQLYFHQRFYSRAGHKAKQLMQMVASVTHIFQLEEAGAPADQVASAIVWFIALVCDYAEVWEYDLGSAIRDKHAYNHHRADHKDAARLSTGGKKW